MSGVRRGAAAILEAAEQGGGGDFAPWLPALFWKEDGEDRYVLFLNEIDEIPTFKMVQFIPVNEGKGFRETVAKTDPGWDELKESSDAFEKKWDARPVERSVAIAVELEPVIEVVNNRRKARSFEVKTFEFERTIYDEDGEATDEKEEVTAPVVGYIAQSPNNFFNVVARYNADEAPIETTPLKITRIGKDTSTTYAVTGYEDLPLDLTNLVEYVENINYLGDDSEEVLGWFADEDDPFTAANKLGELLLEKRITELLDPERYDALLEGVTESMDKFGNKKSKGKGKGKSERPAKTSQRRSRRDEEPEGDDGDDSGDEPEEREEKPAARKAAPKAKAKASAKAKRGASGPDRMAALKERAAARQAA